MENSSIEKVEKTDTESLKEIEAEKQELLNRAKKEILDRYGKGESVELKQFAIGKSYQIGKNFKNEPYSPILSQQKNNFLRTISHSLEAIENLRKKYSKKNVVEILSKKPIQEWPGVVRETPSSKNTGEKRTT